MKVGIIGSGRIGGTLGGLWVKAGHEIAVPLAAADEAALEIARQLVQDAGFEPVVVGPLAREKEFDTGTAVYGKALTAAELRRGLGLSPREHEASNLDRPSGRFRVQPSQST